MQTTQVDQNGAKQDEGWNERLLYRAYDLILSWPLPETAVSDEQEASESNPLKSHQPIQPEKDPPLI